jgi:transcriptional regulator with XRE-family HTH domain
VTGEELREARRVIGLDKPEFARHLGYTGTDRNNEKLIRDYEQGRKAIPLYIARLVWLLAEIAADCNELAPDDWPPYVGDDGKVQWPEDNQSAAAAVITRR